jgi:hypothetical protein
LKVKNVLSFAVPSLVKKAYYCNFLQCWCCIALQADHEDLIHDVAYDFYGKRMATCSSDQTVKVS